ncbi:MAG: GNAT family N-acetyltransferase [Bacillota bacterium]
MLTGDRIQLREYKEDYITKAKDYINDPEVCLNINPQTPFPITLKDEEEWFENQRKDDNQRNFAIITKDDKEYIGGCGINDIDWKNSVVKVGIFIGKKEYRGKGYGTEAMKILLEFIFNQMNINKVMLEVFSFNKRAIKSYKKNGFVEEGRLRENIYRNGKYHDEILMGLLRREYEDLDK